MMLSDRFIFCNSLPYTLSHPRHEHRLLLFIAPSTRHLLLFAEPVTQGVISEAKDTREHINLVFIGHVDAGKSTLSGQILILTGQVDKRTIEKYEKEAKDKNRESWYLAYIMDVSEDERNRGKTVECGRAAFQTTKKRVTLLDAPGHKGYVPSMIAGASQADVGALVISARKGEFEAGFDRTGQTNEHMLLARTLGVQKLFILVNKMDDPTVKWSKERYTEIVEKLTPAMLEVGYKKDDFQFVPVSGYLGSNIKERMKGDLCPWYSGPSFFEIIDDLPPLVRYNDKPLRMPVSARYKDRGMLHVVCKVESGTVELENNLISVPNLKTCTVTGIQLDDGTEVASAGSGENIVLRLKGIEEEELLTGFVLCPASAPGYRTKLIEAQMMVLELNESMPLLTAGFECMFHAHAITSEVKVKALVAEYNKKGKVKAEHPKFVKSGAIVVCKLEMPESIPLEKYTEFPQLGRFTLRDKTSTIAIGKVLRLKPE